MKISFLLMLALAAPLYGMSDEEKDQRQSLLEQQPAFKAVRGHMNVMRLTLCGLLHAAEFNKLVKPVKDYDTIGQLRIKFFERYHPSLATQQGLLLVVDNSCFPFFELVSPAGVSLLGGYEGKGAIMTREHFAVLKAKFFKEVTVRAVPEEIDPNCIFWKDMEAYAVEQVTCPYLGELPPLIMGKKINSENFGKNFLANAE